MQLQFPKLCRHSVHTTAQKSAGVWCYRKERLYLSHSTLLWHWFPQAHLKNFMVAFTYRPCPLLPLFKCPITPQSWRTYFPPCCAAMTTCLIWNLPPPWRYPNLDLWCFSVIILCQHIHQPTLGKQYHAFSSAQEAITTLLCSRPTVTLPAHCSPKGHIESSILLPLPPSFVHPVSWTPISLCNFCRNYYLCWTLCYNQVINEVS